jgi:hypothetical protein
MLNEVNVRGPVLPEKLNIRLFLRGLANNKKPRVNAWFFIVERKGPIKRQYSPPAAHSSQ